METTNNNANLGAGGPTSFDYAGYENVVAKIKAENEKLTEIASKTLTSKDVSSATFLESLNQTLTSVPSSATSIVGTVNSMIESLENVEANYKDREATINSKLSGGSDTVIRNGEVNTKY